MANRKTATTVEEQIAQLQSRGMNISDPEHVKKMLLSVGYYRMGFYWYQFEIPRYRKRNEHKFRSDTSWEKVEALYDFDDRFRNLLAFYLQTIETDIRTYITYTVSNYYKTDPIWFVNPHCVEREFIREMKASYENLKRNEVIKKHHRKHPEDMYAPAWKTLEFMMFGEVQRLYGSIREASLRQQIYARYAVAEEDVFESYVNILRDVRNVCAHSHLLYDKRLYRGIKGRLENLGLVSGEEFTIVGVLKLVYYMLQRIDPEKECEMRERLHGLVNQEEYRIVRFAIARLDV